MKQYKTNKIVRLYTGLIGLSDEQATPRLKFLKVVEPGVYKILDKIEFKVGEKIRLWKVPKKLAAILELEKTERIKKAKLAKKNNV